MIRQEPQTSPPGDEIDQILSAFFQSEMPKPWPKFTPPLSPTVRNGTAPLRPWTEPARPTVWRFARAFSSSRLSLAAAILVMVGGLWLLGGLPLPNRSEIPLGTNPGQPDAARFKWLDLLQPSETRPKKNVKDSISLEQGADGRTGVRIDIREESPPPER
jgi:hypothetical protein